MFRVKSYCASRKESLAVQDVEQLEHSQNTASWKESRWLLKMWDNLTASWKEGDGLGTT